MSVTAKKLEEFLSSLIGNAGEAHTYAAEEDYDNLAEVGARLAESVDERGGELESYETYEDAGILTTDAGLVLRFADGTEYQVTIKRSR